MTQTNDYAAAVAPTVATGVAAASANSDDDDDNGEDSGMGILEADGMKDIK